jgi:hypothetical protein
MVVALPFEVKVTEFWLGPPATSKATIVFNLRVEPSPRFTWLETKDPRNDTLASDVEITGGA